MIKETSLIVKQIVCISIDNTRKILCNKLLLIYKTPPNCMDGVFEKVFYNSFPFLRFFILHPTCKPRNQPVFIRT